LQVTVVGWTLTIGVIVVLLALDLVLATLRPHAVGYREAAAWSVFHIVVAVLFGVVFASHYGWGFGSQYFAGYIVERSLSVDNLFVFVIIMATFAVPREHQQRVLTFGIIAALVLRAIFIALGATLLSALSFMFVVFGVILLWTALRMYRQRDKDSDIEGNALVRLARRMLPVSDRYAGGRLISRVEGRRVVTPLFIVLITIGGTDIVFALDSIPAIFGITSQPYIVFVANAFALLGLRPLFFLVTGLLDRLVYLSSGLAVILAFVGVKLILHWGHGVHAGVPEISTAVSLVVIAAVLAVTTVASLIRSMVAHMKTTIDLPDELLREAQQVARAEGTTLKSVMEEGLRAVIARHRSGRTFHLQDASVPGRGLQTEFTDEDWARIRDASYGEPR